MTEYQKEKDGYLSKIMNLNDEINLKETELQAIKDYKQNN